MDHPEMDSMIEIGNWLKIYGYEVFFNCTNESGFGVFIVKGTQRRPDIVFRKPNRTACFVVEVKTGHGRDIRKAKKIIDYYYLDVLEGRATYYINDNKVEPLCFLVATKTSCEGYLFDDDVPRELIDKKTASIQGRPQKEYRSTYDYSRTLWCLWKTIKNPKYMLGVLLSDKLNAGVGKPAVFVQRFGYNGRWFGQRFDVKPSLEDI